MIVTTEGQRIVTCIFTTVNRYSSMPNNFYRALIFAFVTACFSIPAQTVDEKGKKQGYWKKKDEKTGKTVYEGEFKDDQPTGLFKYYYPNDSVRAVVTFRSGGPASYAKLFHPATGKRMAEGKYVGQEIKDSIWTYYDESGKLLSKEAWVKGKKEGISYVYLPDGAVSEEKTFRNGVEEGGFKQYFEAGKLKSHGAYKAGKLDGRVAYLYPNGVEAAAGFYREGKKSGPWIYRDKEGKVTEKELYKDGELASADETKIFFEKTKIQDITPPAKPPATKRSAQKKK